MKLNRLLPLAPLALALAATAPAQIENRVDLDGLDRLARMELLRSEAELQEAHRLAPLLGLPLRGVDRFGNTFALVSLRDNRPWYISTDNKNAAISTRTNLVHPLGGLGFSLAGNNQVIGIWDGGTPRTTHQEITGRVVLKDAEGLSGDHATHVAGTLIGAGVNANAKGMAFRAKLNAYGFNNDLSEIATAAGGGLRISNHSYGYITGWHFDGANWFWFGDTAISNLEDAGFGQYDASARTLDDIVYQAVFYLPVRSAGNDRDQAPPSQPISHFVWSSGANNWVTSTTVRNVDGNGTGYDTIPYTANAKNVLTVGAVNDVLNYAGPGSVTMSSFSSWGPTDDGRIKPDVVGNGVGLFSSLGGADNVYGSFSGTSMSSPNVTGSLALLRPLWRATNPLDMAASTLKGLAIHTAREAGAAPGPDYRFGWGLVDTASAAQLIVANRTGRFNISEHALPNGTTLRYWVHATGGPVKGTLAWTDPPGPVSTGAVDPIVKRLVNDLDLRFFDGATQFFPWILNPASPGTAATRGDNTRDNVEQVAIDTVPAGWYLAQISHKGTLVNSPQVFSLIASGIDKVLAPSRLVIAPSTVVGSFNANGKVELNDVAPPGGLTLALSTTNVNAVIPATVTVPAGATSVTFPIKTRTVNTVLKPKITAAYFDLIAQATLTIEPGGLKNLTITPNSVVGGTSTTGRVDLSAGAPVGGRVVGIGDNHAKVTTPTSVTVPEAATFVTFPITTLAVTSNVNASVWATLGSNKITKTLTLTP